MYAVVGIGYDESCTHPQCQLFFDRFKSVVARIEGSNALEPLLLVVLLLEASLHLTLVLAFVRTLRLLLPLLDVLSLPTFTFYSFFSSLGMA